MTDPRDFDPLMELPPEPRPIRRDPRRALVYLVLALLAVAIVILALLVAPGQGSAATGEGLRAAAAAVGGPSAPSPVPPVPTTNSVVVSPGLVVEPDQQSDGGGVAGLPPTDTLASLRDGRTGVIAQAVGHGADYLAIPIGPGKLVKVCGPGGCLTLTSTDAGPNHERLVAGRIADVAIGHWRTICGLPDYRGTCRGSWRLVARGGPLPTLPATDTGGVP